jgi:phosphoribosylformimino-5-aminoimidazole carboxamide ribonucleotide (ProFAR) isomerase
MQGVARGQHEAGRIDAAGAQLAYQLQAVAIGQVAIQHQRRIADLCQAGGLGQGAVDIGLDARRRQRPADQRGRSWSSSRAMRFIMKEWTHQKW